MAMNSYVSRAERMFWRYKLITFPICFVLLCIVAVKLTAPVSESVPGTVSQGGEARQVTLGLHKFEYLAASLAFLGQGGTALVRVDSREPEYFRTGDEVAPGIKLSAIYPEYIELENYGVKQTVALFAAQTRLAEKPVKREVSRSSTDWRPRKDPSVAQAPEPQPIAPARGANPPSSTGIDRAIWRSAYIEQADAQSN